MKSGKLILLLLIVVELGLLGLREWMMYLYPISCKVKYRSSFYDQGKYYEKLFNDRKDNMFNPIFWEGNISIGMHDDISEAINRIEKLKFGNDIIPGDVIYVYNEDKELSRIAIRTQYDANIEHKLISYYGEEHIYCSSTEENRYDRTWMTEDCFIKIGRHKDYGQDTYFLYIIIEAFESTSYIAYYDEDKLEDWSSFTWDKSKNIIESNNTSSTKSYSTGRKKKYGDSDTYQGSSQQAADLAAIDAYGANNPDFW